MLCHSDLNGSSVVDLAVLLDTYCVMESEGLRPALGWSACCHRSGQERVTGQSWSRASHRSGLVIGHADDW